MGLMYVQCSVVKNNDTHRLDYVKFVTGERTCGPLPRAKFHVWSLDIRLQIDKCSSLAEAEHTGGISHLQLL